MHEEVSIVRYGQKFRSLGITVWHHSAEPRDGNVYPYRSDMNDTYSLRIQEKSCIYALQSLTKKLNKRVCFIRNNLRIDGQNGDLYLNQRQWKIVEPYLIKWEFQSRFLINFGRKEKNIESGSFISTGWQSRRLLLRATLVIEGVKHTRRKKWKKNKDWTDMRIHDAKLQFFEQFPRSDPSNGKW